MPAIANERMYRNRQRLDALVTTYTSLINKEERTARMYDRKKLIPLRDLHYKHYLDLVKELEGHTARMICLDKIIDIVRSIETADATLQDMQAAIEIFKSHASRLNEEKVDEIMNELDTRQRELQSIQRRMAKPLGEVTVQRQADLDREMEEFFAEEYEDASDFEKEEEEEEEEQVERVSRLPRKQAVLA